MNEKKSFFWTSIIFIVITIFFMIYNPNQSFSWVRLLVGYGVFALIYSILSKISVSDDT